MVLLLPLSLLPQLLAPLAAAVPRVAAPPTAAAPSFAAPSVASTPFVAASPAEAAPFPILLPLPVLWGADQPVGALGRGKKQRMMLVDPHHYNIQNKT